jgi:KaiC/GvpD/RAD55 family RecA-like ATPase
MYDLSGTLEGYESVPPGTNLLLASRDHRKNRERVLDTLADGLADGTGAVVVTLDDSAETVREQLSARTHFDGHQLAVIDCYSGGDRTEKTLENGVFVYRVPSPADLTAIGIGIVDCFRRLSDAGVEDSRIGVLSLSTLLEHSDEAEVFKFSHVVSSRLDSAGFLGLFTIDRKTVDTHSYRVISEAFDDVLEG